MFTLISLWHEWFSVFEHCSRQILISRLELLMSLHWSLEALYDSMKIMRYETCVYYEHRCILGKVYVDI